jgi:methyltransferase (TIGR00027 family)
METGRASRTAFRVALRRAIHQVLDKPPVLDDPIAVPLLGAQFVFDPQREMHPLARAFRAYMAARSRFAEDQLAAAVSRSPSNPRTDQYVLLGAGLDTFAYRNPFPRLRVFEVDFPATQTWKRMLLAEAAIELPSTVCFVPLDFEHKAIEDGLREGGLDFTRPAFFGWLGVVPYLTLDAFRATLETIARMPAGSGVCFDFAIDPKTMKLSHRLAFRWLAARVAKAGEPFRLLFTAQTLEAELRRAGFRRVELCNSEQLNALYFAGRADGLKLATPGMGMMATAWV